MSSKKQARSKAKAMVSLLVIPFMAFVCVGVSILAINSTNSKYPQTTEGTVRAVHAVAIPEETSLPIGTDSIDGSGIVCPDTAGFERIPGDPCYGLD